MDRRRLTFVTAEEPAALRRRRVAGCPRSSRARRRHAAPGNQPGGYRVDARRDRARAADDAGAGVLLRRTRPIEKRPQHDDDELRVAGLRRRALGAHRLFARVLDRRALDRRPVAACFCAASGSSRRARFRTCCSWRIRATFAIITAALISGSIVERMRFSTYVAVHHAVGAACLQPRSRTGSGAADGWRNGARSILPAGPSSTSMPRSPRSSPRSSSASGRTIRLRRCCRTTCRSRCLARACSGSDGSGSMPAARWPRARSRASRS